jgi:site-specific DNA recombinase
MTGSRNHGRNYYRCWNPTTHAEAIRLDHPTVLYLREDKIVATVDQWIVRIFEPGRLAATVRTLQEAQTTELDHAAIAATRAAITASNTRLERYRAALDAGTDPTIVNAWITEVTAARTAAEHRLKQLTAKRILTEADIRTLIEGVGDVMGAFRDARPELKADLYDRMGLTIRYNHLNRTARLTIDSNRSCTKLCPRGDLNPHALHGH